MNISDGNIHGTSVIIGKCDPAPVLHARHVTLPICTYWNIHFKPALCDVHMENRTLAYFSQLTFMLNAIMSLVYRGRANIQRKNCTQRGGVCSRSILPCHLLVLSRFIYLSCVQYAYDILNVCILSLENVLHFMG